MNDLKHRFRERKKFQDINGWKPIMKFITLIKIAVFRKLNYFYIRFH